MLKAKSIARNLINNRINSGRNSNITKTNSFKTDFVTSEAQIVFISLQKVFIKAPILHHFDLKCHILIRINISSYSIKGVFKQITLNQQLFNLVTADYILLQFENSQCHLVVFFSRKMIPAETQYKADDQELLAIVEAFKT